MVAAALGTPNPCRARHTAPQQPGSPACCRTAMDDSWACPSPLRQPSTPDLHMLVDMFSGAVPEDAIYAAFLQCNGDGDAALASLLATGGQPAWAPADVAGAPPTPRKDPFLSPSSSGPLELLAARFPQARGPCFCHACKSHCMQNLARTRSDAESLRAACPFASRTQPRWPGSRSCWSVAGRRPTPTPPRPACLPAADGCRGTGLFP